jgi:hypothetical protein
MVKLRSRRGSDENLFSISGASEILSRSRRTITRALAGVPADAVQHGLKLWRMQRIVEAVNKNTQAPILTAAQHGGGVLTGVAAEAHLAFERYDAAYDAMSKLVTIEERRAAAHEVAALARESLNLMRERDIGCGLHEEHVDLRGDRVRLLMVRGLEDCCGWTSLQAWACLDPPDEEDGKAA